LAEKVAKERQLATSAAHAARDARGRVMPVTQKIESPGRDRNESTAVAYAAQKSGVNRQYVADAKKRYDSRMLCRGSGRPIGRFGHAGMKLPCEICGEECTIGELSAEDKRARVQLKYPPHLKKETVEKQSPTSK
jgi:hypothetical protein